MLTASSSGRGSLHFSEEGLSQRGRGTLRRGPEDGPDPLQDLRPQDAGELGRLIHTKSLGLIPYPIYIKGASECRVLLFHAPRLTDITINLTLLSSN